MEASALKPLKLIEKVAGKIAPGRTPSFIEAHILKALEVIGDEGSIGRIRLSKILGLGEGVTRTLIRHLKREGLIEVSRSGITLSEVGRSILAEVTDRMSGVVSIPESPLTVGPHNVAVLVRGSSANVRYGVEQRDAAVKVGALGATTLLFKDGRLTIPGLADDILDSSEAKAVCRVLIAELNPSEGDVIIIGSAMDERTAEIGAKTAAMELLKG